MASLSLLSLLFLASFQLWTWTDSAGESRSAADLKALLQLHALWLESGGEEGAQANLRRCKLPGADLARAQLSRAVLGIADLSQANLEGADLAGANLWTARLPSARLSGADLTGAMLVDTVLKGSDLREAKLVAANLRRTTLSDADLRGADLRFANLAFSVGITASQVQQAKNWNQAYFDEDMLSELGLPEGHNEELQKRHQQEDPETYRRIFGR